MAGSEDQARPVPDDRENGLVVLRVRGVPIVVAPSWFLIAAIITVLFAPVAQRQLPEIGAWAYAVAFTFAVLLYVSVLIHELGHTLVALAFGIPVRRITLQLLGGVSELTRPAPTPGKEFLIAVAGPVLSLVLAVAGFGFYIAGDWDGVARLLLLQLAGTNLLVGLFNLLPGLPLDGGRMVRALVWSTSGRAVTGTRAAAWAGRIVAFLTLLVPFAFAATTSGQAPSFFAVIWAALIAAFIWSGASQALSAADVEERLPLLVARGLARRAVPVAGDWPLARALSALESSGARAMVVVDGGDRPVAIVSEQAVSAVPMERRPWVTASSVARRLDQGSHVAMGLMGEELLEHLRRFPLPEYLVMDDHGRVFGVLSMSDVLDVAGVRGSSSDR